MLSALIVTLWSDTQRLVNFTRLPIETLEELREHLDSPSNGFTLSHDLHEAFDAFNWCLKKTKNKNIYDVKIYNDGAFREISFQTSIHFQDHSNDFSNDSVRKRKPPIALPNPTHIEIHSALAGISILHMSGAGKFFDELLDKHRDDEGNVPAVRSFQELEALMEFGTPLITVAAN